MSMEFTKHAILVSLLFLLLACASTSSRASQKELTSISDELIGTWLVKEVHINTLTSRSNRYQWNDPRLKWRILEITSNEIKNNLPENIHCTSLREERIPLDYTFSLGEKSINDININLVAYGISNSEQPNEVIKFLCSDGALGDGMEAGANIQGAWLIRLNSNEWGLRWYGDTILVITKIQSNNTLLPSFDCIISSNSTENAICESIELSGYDRSIAEAYGNAYRFFDEMQEYEILENLRLS